jgi:hypothetical protein
MRILLGLILAVTVFDCLAQGVPGKLKITLLDSMTGQATAARIRITQHEHVVNVVPKNNAAVMYGLWDHADGYSFQPDSAFYVNSDFELSLAAGEYVLTVSKGMEYLDVIRKIRITSAQETVETIGLQRWIDMAGKKWYSADGHIHIRRSPAEDPLLMTWIKAEDVRVGVLLRMGDFWATYYDQYAWGTHGIYENDKYFLAPGQEDPRTPELGHAIGIGASDRVRYTNEYYFYDKVFDRLHKLGGLAGYAHHAETFHGYRGLMLDGLRKKVDMLEVLQYCVDENPLHTDHYYHMLDLGYAMTAIAGSDFPWCGKDHDNGRPERNARIGNVRFYTYVDEPFTYTAWLNALRKGHTFVTSGPMLSLTVNNKLPGDTVRVKKGATITINASAFGHADKVALNRVELIVNGKVIPARASPRSNGEVTIRHEMTAENGCWIALRVNAGESLAAHTTPVYVSVDGGGFHNRETVLRYTKLADQYLLELQHEIEKVNNDPQFQSWRYRKGLEKRITDAKAALKNLRALVED